MEYIGYRFGAECFNAPVQYRMYWAVVPRLELAMDQRDMVAAKMHHVRQVQYLLHC